MARSGGPKNVQSYLDRENELRLNREHVAAQQTLSLKANFEQKRTKSKYHETKRSEELQHFEFDVLEQRRARLREFYDEEERMYAEELAKMGMTIRRQRD
mmetsp:Transcript_60874/g.83592  ORF Transcript_60874/g.83592 Transcript_60874/m.83592 type:complete len:100 (-) Transcript_60874:243-542(-)|eukprot:CAMPEP_0185746348 /NCGR_PEP_ID=MMETSP1174-20130828/4879_1 /TAXON_ID=35687 /ORGANISM="Dictyocha speculum, Strain CCMP1381" /LENGTH=99 /DNA_ID=CAMNT_0028420961 /DNA_START=41 /DNA_END=340 /DNA_ORIENTATION=+